MSTLPPDPQPPDTGPDPAADSDTTGSGSRRPLANDLTRAL